MSLETRLRNTGQQPGSGAGGSSNSAGLAGTGAYYILGSANTSFPNSLVALAGANVSFSVSGSNLTISSNTGGAANSAGLAGTGPLYILQSGNSTLPNSKVITAGSSVTLTTDATSVYITAITNTFAGSGGLAGTGSFFVSYIADSRLSNERILTAGTNVTVRTDSTSIYIDASTGAGTINQGSAGFLAFYPANGNTIDDSFISTTTGAGLAALNFQALTSQIVSPNTGDFWVLNSAGLFLQYYWSGTAFYTRLTQTDGTVSSTSAGLAGTGPFYVLYTSGNATLPNSRKLTAGTNITVSTDASNVYISASTGAGSSNPGTIQLKPQEAKLYASNSAARIDAGTPFFRLLYSSKTLQYGIYSMIVPQDYSSNPYVRLYYGADSTLASARSITWLIDQWGISANQGRASGYYADTFGGVNSVSIALSAGYSSGTIQQLTIPLATVVSFAAGRMINLRIAASANQMGNAEFVQGSLEYTKA